MSASAIRLLAAALLAGCGGGGDSTATEAGSGSSPGPQPAEPVGDLLGAFGEVGADRDCDAALRLIHPVQLPRPEAGAKHANCASALRQVRYLQGFQPSDSAEFGSAAIVDGDRGGEPVALILALDESRHFKWIGLTNSRHEVPTQPLEEVDYERRARAFVEALRDGDCKAAHRYVAPASRLSYADEAEFCARFKHTFMTAPEGLGARLRADPEAVPVDLGGTRDDRFFALATSPAGYRTIVVTGSGNAPAVFDTVPVER